MRCLLLAMAVILATASYAAAQGYYDRNLVRNPVTGRMEVVGPSYGRSALPYGRDGRDYYGARFNPYSGTAVQSQVRRNPVTGRLQVQNEYYNPWTGARVQTATRFNPYTNRYETVQAVAPPYRPIPEDAPAEPTGDDEQRPARPKPRVIETNPPETSPPVPEEGDF